MGKINSFIDKHFNVIVVGLLSILFLRSCGGDMKSVNKRLDTLTLEVRALKDTSVTQTDLQIEGLKAEKRMIQSTDRKLIDVQRQSEIDREIKRLEEK